MEVTKHNFNEELDSVLESIKSCTFMAIDGEFTGLDAFDGGNAAPFDTPEERYNKQRLGSTDFLLVQFGLCTFQVDAEKQRYEARPYNFYVFPKPHNRQAPDRRFLCQSSSIDFLISQGFDFNKVFREGIPYLMPEAEQSLKANLARRHEEARKLLSPGFASPGEKKGSMPVPEEQKPFLNGVFDKISNFLDSDESEPLPLPPCNAFQRKLIYQSVEEKFPLVHIETVTGEKKERYLLVHRTKNADDRLKREQGRQALEMLELDIQVGFSKVIRAISESGKLVVGHNMLLDVIHSVNQFHCHLPEEFDDFKTVVKTVFPRLLDTKLMASTHPFKEHILYTSLDEVRLTVQQPPFRPVNIDIADGFERYKDGGGSLHEAGYDAFLTGSCFAHMTRFLGTFQSPKDEFLLPTSRVVEPFVNKIFLMRINDIPYLDLNGPDLTPQRNHVFHVTFPREWKPADLYSLFQPYGTIQISWLSDSSAFVALHKKENAEIALKALSQETGVFRVVSYASHQRNRSYKWSSSSSSPSASAAAVTPTGGQKRKMADANLERPPSKIDRQSLSQESPTRCAAIPEAEMETSPSEENHKPSRDTNPSSSQTSERKPSSAGGNGSDTKEAPPKEKLFEESDAW
ncbi:poly(A)-specific ribonuclease PARN [Aplysia californica]|uniref:Poly(A)-specific ribonuclease PARN n=1 Tax=Aplysia californica TaxID=6500 RepID=A0ABM0JWV5_APLCA|nr:poly(A)-specific ribonuclease PARN [Aplysia californica]